MLETTAMGSCSQQKTYFINTVNNKRLCYTDAENYFKRL
jgi:hypothetical protein